MILLRRTLFFLFTLIYVIFCPLIILYSLGIIFNPDTQTIEKTGIIYLSSIPPDADVYVNAKHFPQKTPAVIRNLAPGDYRIKLTHKNYENWEKILGVQQQKAANVEDILLIPKDWPEQKIPVFFERLIPFKDHPFFLLQNGPLVKDLYIYREKIMEQHILLEKNISPLMKKESPFNEDIIIRIYSMESSPYLLLETTHNQKLVYLWVNLKESPAAWRDITPLILKNPDKILWEKRNGTDLYLLSQDKLSYINLDQETVHSDIMSEVKNLALLNNELYVLTLDNDFLLVRLNEDNPRVLVESQQLKEKLFSSYQNLDITVLPENLIVLLSKEGALLLNRLPYLFVQDGVKGFNFDPLYRRLLFWTDSRIGYIDLKTSQEDSLFEQGPLLVWLEVQGKNIKQAFWANKGANIIYTTHKDIFITETKSFNQPAAYKIADIKPNTVGHYREEKIFYLDNTNGYLSSTEVIPRKDLSRE